MRLFKGNHKKYLKFWPRPKEEGKNTNLQNRENLSCLQLYIVELGNEHGGHTLEDGCSVHVHSGPDGENEPADPLVYAIVLFNTLHHGGKGC